MKSTLFILMIFIFLMCACNKEDIQASYPKTFVFSHSNITNEKGFVIGENESYSEINTKSGNLDTLKNQIADSLFDFIRKQGCGSYIESIVLLNKDSIQLNAWQNGNELSVKLPANIENSNGEIIDKDNLGYLIHWDSTRQELIYCLTLTLGILDRKGISFPEIDYDFCTTKDVNLVLQNILLNSIYMKNDTLGIYLLDMIYK